MLKEILYIGAGGFIGSVMRYLVSQTLNPATTAFPWGTLTVNILGCLIIGIIAGLTLRHPSLLSPGASLFLTVGLCGGFTTFSTFSKEALALLQNNCTLAFALYVIGSITIGVAAVAIGYTIVKIC